MRLVWLAILHGYILVVGEEKKRDRVEEFKHKSTMNNHKESMVHVS